MDVTITAALIVKDEARCIERCLKSVCHLFDEVIIVDTGSCDSTIELINKHSFGNLRLFQIQWPDDFSYVRNFAISKATSRFIFFIDADEYLSTTRLHILSEFGRINKLCVASPTVYCPTIINHNNNALKNVPRVFRNNGEFYYSGFVHEEIRHTENVNITSDEIDVDIYHDGYLDYVMNEKNKKERNRLLNKKNILKEPANLRWHFFYYRDAFADLSPMDVYVALSAIIKIQPEAGLISGNIKKEPYSFAILDLLAQSLLMTLDNEADLMVVIGVMREIIPFNSNSLYYELSHELLKHKSLAMRRINQILGYQALDRLYHHGMLHSDGLHIDAVLSFYLYEAGFIKQSKKLLLSVENNGFVSEMTALYLKNLSLMSKEVVNEH